MLEKPIWRLSEKSYDAWLIGLVILMYVAACVEADIYVPAFPQMVEYFGVAENQIQLVLGVNFTALSIAGLITGPLSDCYGRKKTLLAGLFLFVISSLGCVITNQFYVLLAWRLLQGVAISVPMVVGAACLLDRYPAEKAGQLISFCNSVIATVMAVAPVIGVILSEYMGWRANFTLIFILAALILVGSLVFLGETLPNERRQSFGLKKIGDNYKTLLTSFPFVAYSLICNMPFAALVMYIASLSLIFVNHLGVSIQIFCYYQASTSVIFIVFSLISAKLIPAKGLDYTKNTGMGIAVVGVLLLLLVSSVWVHSPEAICGAMMVFTAGGTLMVNSVGLKALSLFPEMNGASMALITAIRQVVTVACVVLSEIYFDGTIQPIAYILGGYALLCALLEGLLYFCKSTSLQGVVAS